MKAEIHPAYEETEVHCGCGNTFQTRSTKSGGHITVEVCSQCHPFYTGKQKILDSGGRVARFEKRYGKRKARQSRSRQIAALPTPELCRNVHRPGVGSRLEAGRRCDMTQPVQTIDVLLAEHAELEHALADPELHSKPDEARKVGRRFARLAPIVATHRKLVSARGDLEAARELAADDESFAAEVAELESRVAELDTQLTDMLAPRDPHDADDIVLEVKSGEGGEESALFAADLARMYIRYAERHGWTVTVLDETTSDLGGYKDATLTIASKGDTVDGVWSRLKFEGGVHRVQRVPVTESQGRVHTSAAGVLVYPEPEEVGEVQIDESDLRIDVYRSSGKGGQGVNTTDSAVRITHLPTGIVVTCQNERSQLQNKARALQVLAARLQALAEEQAQADASADRASQIRTVDRSERIRTYNFPENRIADHRINFKAHNLDQVLDGDLDALFDALSAADKQSRLQQA